MGKLRKIMPITLSELSEFSSEAQGTWGIYTLKPEGPWLSMLVPWIFCSTILESMVYCSGQKNLSGAEMCILAGWSFWNK